MKGERKKSSAADMSSQPGNFSTSLADSRQCPLQGGVEALLFSRGPSSAFQEYISLLHLVSDTLQPCPET